MIFLYINLKHLCFFINLNIYNQILIGNGYDGSKDNDVLLLDISDNGNYIWTEFFDPSDPQTQPAPLSTSSLAPSSHTPPPPPAPQKSNKPKPNKNPVIIGVIIGCVGGGLFIGTFMLYKRNKKKVIRIPPG